MKILHLEDNPRDTELVREMLTAEWPDCILTVVATREAFMEALQHGGHDIILSDFQLPGFNGLEALELTRTLAPHLPFIFFSGTIGEERAIEAVRAGAADYVIKDRMQRLPVTIQRVMRESEELRVRRRIEDALAQEQYLLLILMENLPDHIYFKDINSRFLTVSRSMAKRLGLTPGALKGKTDADIFSGEHARLALEDEQRIITTGQPLVDIEEKETWPDGSVTWALSTKLPLRDGAGKIVGTFGVSRDITARKHAEARIREQAEIINQTPIAIIITDLSHRVTYCNMGAVALYGLSRNQLIGHTAEDFFTTESMEKLRIARQAAITAGQWNGEVTLTTRAGRHIQAEFHMSLIYDPAGRPTARLSIAIDITEKKKLEAQFLRAQRLESLGMLAAGIAHDLNNVLAPVLMGAPLLRARATHPSDLRVLQTIENSASRGAALVRQILSFAHGASGEKTLIQVKHLLRDIAGLIEETFPKSITLQENVPGDLWAIQGNPTQLHQVLLNLCVNARDAMLRGGTLRLAAENRLLDGRGAQPHPEANPGSYIVIEVTDTGTGIPPEVLARIWDPFFTTKGEDKGTGLGLVTVRGIAANHGGFVTVESEIGRGTTFRVFLPAAEQAAPENPHSPATHPFHNRGQGELVLVVDDEVSIRDLITAFLSRFGYRVIAAVNGLEAMALYTPRVDEIALVVTDLGMPEMDGGELAAALTRLNPNVKILFMSGAGDVGKLAQTVPAGARILGKPFMGESLLSAVNETLHAVPSGDSPA
jgi:two-component system cell cycle sensor histidine kinase/response regulator CckA